MAVHARAAQVTTWRKSEVSPQRLAFVALLVAAPLLPHLSSNGFDFPAVSSGWVCLPFCALLALPLVDLRARRRLFELDLLALLSLALSLACWRVWRGWPMLLMYPVLLYLAARMLAIARVGRRERASVPAAALRLTLPRAWLVAGIVVLCAVHASWALQGSARTDVARGGVQGALNIAHGHALYGRAAGTARNDPHTDTYGPVDYEAYLPFVGVADGNTAARLTTLFFDLLTALGLFALGRQIRGPTTGVVLAYCWLAFPFTLYADALGLNDSIVAAALVGTLLVARSPVRRGAMVAVAAWTKFSPLALLPLLAGQREDGRSSVRGVTEFVAAFALATALVFVPALAHGSLDTFVSRTFGFQAGRSPSVSIWAVLEQHYASSMPWIRSASRVAHGLIVAVTATLALVLFRIPRRGDVIGIAAASAAILIALQICLSYYAFSYVLWFAPLVLVALLLGCFSTIQPPPATDRALHGAG